MKPMLSHHFRAEQCKTNGFSTSWSGNIRKQLVFHHFGAKTQQTLTIDTYNGHNRHSQQTLTIDTYNRHVQQTHARDTYNRHLQQTRTIDTRNRHVQYTLTIDITIDTYNRHYTHQVTFQSGLENRCIDVIDLQL